jgi:arsenite methyltransferase
MRPSLLDILADPVSATPLQLDATVSTGDEVVSGTLVSATGARYPIVDGIPRFVGGEDAKQEQTRESFAFKWTNTESFASDGMRRQVHEWLLKRYGFGSGEEMRDYFRARGPILDAGCGAGLATAAWLDAAWDALGTDWVGADISLAIDVARQRLGGIGGTHFVQADVLNLPFKAGSFGLIFSEGVLHHTPSTERAFKSLVPLLAPGGEIMIYVYRKKAPLREFTDDYVRDQIAELAPEEAWAAMRPLTRLGLALSELKAEIEVEEDIPLLQIPAGRYDVQRLIYWHIAKLFWNENMTFEENNHVNFDWYAPQYAHRQTEVEVRRWYEECGLEVTRLDRDDAGFTVRGVLGD